MTPQTAALLADYNRWMDARMYEAAGNLDAAELAADKGAFFGSILGTLNHITVADLIWLRRFAQQPPSSAALEALSDFPRAESLRQTLSSDLPSLHPLRQRLDEIIVRWAGELTPEILSTELSYTSTAGVASRKNYGAVIQHFFNHQTHHRGQASTLLLQSGVDVGVTDLNALIPTSQA